MMSNDLVFYQHLAAVLCHGPVALATVIHVGGSVPREVGAKLMLCADGQSVGTVGGGAGEAKVLRYAQAVLATGQKQQVTIDLSGAPNREIQGICGGQMQVWVERWDGDRAIALTHQILAHLNRGQSITLVMPLAQDAVAYVSHTAVSHTAEKRTGSAPNPQPQVAPQPQTYQITLQPPPTLLIVGAGHCGIQLATVAALSGFQVMVQDDRHQWANRQNFPRVTCLFHDPIAQVIDALADYDQLYAALVTRGFDYDLPALRSLLQRPIPCRYIGMMGSQKRVRTVLQALHPDRLPPERLRSLHAPIGLDIGAITPEEIAVSICAELIMVRRGETGLVRRAG